MLRKCFLARSWTEYVPRHWEPKVFSKSLGGCATHSASACYGDDVTRNFRSLEKAVAMSNKEKENRGFFSLPELDYDVTTGIPPLCSRKQFEMQYYYFHKDAVEKLNAHTIGTELEGHNLDVVLRHTAFDATRAVVHTAAAEHFNYCFWYRSLRPWGTSVPARLSSGLQKWRSAEVSMSGGRMAPSVGSSSSSLVGNTASNASHEAGSPAIYSFDTDPVKEIIRRMKIKALTQVDKIGWVYLVWTGKKIDVLYFQHGLCPISSDIIPLLCLNINEGAFWFDYSNSEGGKDRFEEYVNNFFKTCNWIVADRNYCAAVHKL